MITNVDPDQLASPEANPILVYSLFKRWYKILKRLCELCTSSGKCFVFVCYVALRPKSTAMVMAGRSVHLTTLFPGQA